MIRRAVGWLAPWIDPALIEARGEAYKKALGAEPQVLHSTDRKNPHIDLYVFPPAGRRDFVAIVTGGMSDLRMPVPGDGAAATYVELCMGMGQHQHWATNCLKVAAEYPFDHGEFFGIHHTVAFGAELGDGSTLSAFLFVKPRFLPPELAQFDLGGKSVQFLQAVPITTAEREFAVAEGSARLEALLEAHGHLILRDQNRQSVI